MDVDIAIIGAGPAGLSFAALLGQCGLKVAIIDPQTEQALSDPNFDGREIALTHASRDLMTKCGMWDHLPTEEISPLKDAHVFNGPSLFALKIKASQAKTKELGWLVPNHLIRKSAYEAAKATGIVFMCERRLTGVTLGPDTASLCLSDGTQMRAKLMVAADTRFSETRRMIGIGAEMRDFGRTMMVCRMSHDVPHDHVAWEWFGYGQTLALLPLNGNVASAVVTLEPEKMKTLMALDDDAFNRDITRRFEGRLGQMRLTGTRHAYPLVGVYAHRFHSRRSVLIGDAAVGMHPVTAHGFNFGIQSADRLASRVLSAIKGGRDFAAPHLLADYDREHRIATWPLYQSTNLISALYTDDRLPSRLLRNAGLRVAEALYPIKHAIASHITQVR